MITSLYDYCCSSVTQLCLILYNPIEWSTMPGFPVLHQLPESAQTYVHWDGDCTHEVKRCFLLVRKVMKNLDSILKSRDFTLPTKFHIVKAMLFSVVMYGCESWTIKKAECWRIDAFKLWCWRRLLRVPWTARRSNQPILKEISPDYSFEGLMLKLNEAPIVWPPDTTHWIWLTRIDSLEDPNAGKDRRQEEKGMTEDEMVGWHH